MKFLLASSSQYRAELLKKLGIDFTQFSPNIDESSQKNENARHLSVRLSILKALEAAKHFPEQTIIASDQTAEVTTGANSGSQQHSHQPSYILGKPHIQVNAIEQLTNLSGNSALFYTGLCLLTPVSNLPSTIQSTLSDLPDLSISTLHKFLSTLENLVEEDSQNSLKNNECLITLKLNHEELTKQYYCQFLVDIYKVTFRKLNQQSIENYVTKEQPLDCAGSFKSEGLGIALFESMRGDDPNSLIGLPLIKLCSCLNKIGYTVV